MKSLLSLIVIASSMAFSTTASAVYFDVIGACSNKPVYAGSFKTDITESVGIISIDIFETHKIPFIGTENGMNSIIGTPVGDDAIEVISDTKLRAYGWCFSINGLIPDILSSQAYLTKQNDYISWFYAFSTYESGAWVDYCVPSHTIKAAQFCK